MLAWPKVTAVLLLQRPKYLHTKPTGAHIQLGNTNLPSHERFAPGSPMYREPPKSPVSFDCTFVPFSRAVPEKEVLYTHYLNFAPPALYHEDIIALAHWDYPFLDGILSKHRPGGALKMLSTLQVQ